MVAVNKRIKATWCHYIKNIQAEQDWLGPVSRTALGTYAGIGIMCWVWKCLKSTMKKTCNQPSFTKKWQARFHGFPANTHNLNPEKSKCILLPLFYSEKEYFSFCSFCVTLHWVPSNILLHINLRPLALTSLATWSLHFQSDLKGWTVLLQTK